MPFSEHPISARSVGAREWIIITAIPIVVLVLVFGVLRYLDILLDAAQAAAVLVGGISLAFSAHAAVNASHMAKLEWERRRTGSRAVLRADVQYLAVSLEAARRSPQDLSGWNSLIAALEVVEARLSKKLDQLGTIAADYTVPEFLNVHEFYLSAYQHLFRTGQLRLPDGDAKDVEAGLGWRRIELDERVSAAVSELTKAAELLPLDNPRQAFRDASSRNAKGSSGK